MTSDFKQLHSLPTANCKSSINPTSQISTCFFMDGHFFLRGGGLGDFPEHEFLFPSRGFARIFFRIVRYFFSFGLLCIILLPLTFYCAGMHFF